MLDPMSRTPRRMWPNYPVGLASARSRPRVSPCLRRVRGPRRRGAGLPLRPHLADVGLHLHLRPRVPGHLRRLPRRGVLHPGCALQPTRTTRSASRRTSRSSRRSSGSSTRSDPSRPTTGSRPTRTASARRIAVEYDGQSACVFHNRADFAPSRRGLRRCTRRPGPRAGPQPARDQARRLLAAADPAHVPQRRAPGRDGVHRGLDRRVRPARLGTRAATTSTGTARATPRPTSRRSRSTSPTSPS